MCLILLGSVNAAVFASENALNPSTIFIAGDSTAASYNKPEQQGWGGVFASYFDAESVVVKNFASGGKSTRTFITSGIWQKLLDGVQKEDFVLIQFGHNDASAINDKTRARGTIPVIGEQYVDIDNLLTQKHERVYSYGHYIRKMVDDVKARGAKPILLSLTTRNLWESSRIERGLNNYAHLSYQLARELNIPYIDLTNAAADVFEAMGELNTGKLFPNDHTHFNPEGANIFARLIVASLKGLRPSLPTSYFSDIGINVTSYDWTFVKLPIVADRQKPSIFLVGDSTVRNGRGDGQGGEWGWGDFVSDYLPTHNFNIINRAVGGLSSRTYVTGGHWQRALNMMKPGDAVLLQFGHNDSSAINDKDRARGTLKGIGNELVHIDNMLTNKKETVHTYGWYLRKMIGQALASGIQPIVCSPVPRRKWNNELFSIHRLENSYPQWSKVVAEQANIPFIDLHFIIADEYELLGLDGIDAMYADKHTHTTKKGAQFSAEIVAQNLHRILKDEK